MSRKLNAQWFKDRLADKQISQRKLSKLLDIDPAAVSYMLRDKPIREMKMDEAIAFASIVGVPLEDVLVNAGLDLPAEGRGMATVIGHVDPTGELRRGSVEAPRRVPAPPEAPAGLAAARFKTPMSAAAALDGWLIYFDDSVTRVSPEAAGRLCVAVLGNHGRAVVGIVNRGYARGSFTVHPWTPGAAPMENVMLEKAAPILWIRTAP